MSTETQMSVNTKMGENYSRCASSYVICMTNVVTGVVVFQMQMQGTLML